MVPVSRTKKEAAKGEGRTFALHLSRPRFLSGKRPPKWAQACIGQSPGRRSYEAGLSGDVRYDCSRAQADASNEQHGFCEKNCGNVRSNLVMHNRTVGKPRPRMHVRALNHIRKNVLNRGVPVAVTRLNAQLFVDQLSPTSALTSLPCFSRPAPRSSGEAAFPSAIVPFDLLMASSTRDSHGESWTLDPAKEEVPPVDTQAPHTASPCMVAEAATGPRSEFSGQCANLRKVVNEMKGEVAAVAERLASAEAGLTACTRLLDALDNADVQAIGKPDVELPLSLTDHGADAFGGETPVTKKPRTAATRMTASDAVNTKDTTASSTWHADWIPLPSVRSSAATLDAELATGCVSADNATFVSMLEALCQQVQCVRGTLRPLGTRLNLQDLRLCFSIDVVRALGSSGPTGDFSEASACIAARWG